MVYNQSGEQVSEDHELVQEEEPPVGPAPPAPKEGITLEDDVESMLSEQFNTSNESMFKVRGVGNLGGGGAGDSTYRCNDSMYDEDRGLISESEDGWNPDKDREGFNIDNKIDDISEHSSDECTDSEPEEY